MRLLLDTFVRWLIAAGVYLGAGAYFRVPPGTHLPSFYANMVAVAVVVFVMILVTAFLFDGTDRWFLTLAFAGVTSLVFCACYRIGGSIDSGWEPLNGVATFILVLALLLMSGHLVARTYRFMLLLNCWCDPEEAKKWAELLDSGDHENKSLAVRTMADYLGNDFAGFGDWPVSWCDTAELQAHVAIVKRLWAARQAMVADCPSQEWLLQRLGRNMKRSFWRLANYRVDWMISRIGEPFVRGDAESETPISSESPLLQDALPPLEPVRLIEAMEARITETLQESAQVLNDAPAGTLIVDSEEPVGELLAQLFLEAYQVELLLHMGSLQVNVSEIFSTDSGPLRSFRFFEELVERAGNAVKDTLMDLNLMAEEVQAEPTSEDLPFMSPDEFVHAMRPHIEQAFKQFVEITNQTPTGLILVAEEAGLCRIFAQLHVKALETGLELRLRRAESLGTTRPVKEKAVAVPHLRKAASPPLPAPFLSWAAKYRCMRIAGTRFPLIHEEPRQRESADDLHDLPITSVKPGPGGTF